MKISICLFLLRIVDTKKLRVVLWGMVGFLVLFTVVFVALFLAICSPMKAYWNVMPQARCMSDTQVEMITVGQGSELLSPSSLFSTEAGWGGVAVRAEN